MIDASEKSHIIGDVVVNYKKFANGKQAILFATDVMTGKRMEEKFKAAGVKAKFLSADSTDKERLDSMLDFKDHRVQVLLNVDLFDEGLDVPGIECVIMARPTMSVSKFLQMIGRGRRPAPGKEFAIIIDHVGNVTTHGLPCETRNWTLDRIVKKRDKTNFIRICSNVECNAPYDRTLSECPWCGTLAVVANRGASGARPSPIEVDGDLELLDPETIRQMEKATQLLDPGIMAKRIGATHGHAAGIKAMKNQQARIRTQEELSHVIAEWAGLQRLNGYNDRAIHKKYFLQMDMTITESLAQPRAEMIRTIEILKGEIQNEAFHSSARSAADQLSDSEEDQRPTGRTKRTTSSSRQKEDGVLE